MIDKSATLAPTLALPGAALAAVPASAPSSARGDGVAMADFSAVLASLTLGTDLADAPEGAAPPSADLAAIQAANAGKTGIVGNRPGKILPPGKQPAEPELGAGEHADADAEDDHQASSEVGSTPAQDGAAGQPRLSAPTQEQLATSPIIDQGPAAASLPAAKATSDLAEPKSSPRHLLNTTASQDVAATSLPREGANSAAVAPVVQDVAPQADQVQPVLEAASLQPAQTRSPVDAVALSTKPVAAHAEAPASSTPQAELPTANIKGEVAIAAPIRHERAAVLAQETAVAITLPAALSPVDLLRTPMPHPIAVEMPSAATVQAPFANLADAGLGTTRPEAPGVQRADASVSPALKDTPRRLVAEAAILPGKSTPPQSLFTDLRVDPVAPHTAPVTTQPAPAEAIAIEKADTLHASISARAIASGELTPQLAPAPMPEPLPAVTLAQADVRPALVTVPAPSGEAVAGQDIAALVDRIVEARAAAAPDSVRASLVHHEFGSVSLRLRTEESHIHVTLGSADPTFAPAVHAAAAASRASHADDGDRREQPLQQPQQQPGYEAGTQNAPTSQQQQSSRNPASAGERTPSRDNGSGRSASEQAQPNQTASAPDRRTGIYA
jgi:hypothetical protein